MEVSLRLADTIVSLRVRRHAAKVYSQGLTEAKILRNAKREENIRAVLAEKERLLAKVMMNRFYFL